jgi:signal transduction histidine kinase
VTLFRALRELLINVAKHAAAREARVRIECEEGLLRVIVEDDGQGFDPDEESEGFGLLSLRDRLQHLGGRLDIESAPGRGARISAVVPLLRPDPSALR